MTVETADSTPRMEEPFAAVAIALRKHGQRRIKGRRAGRRRQRERFEDDDVVALAARFAVVGVSAEFNAPGREVARVELEGPVVGANRLRGALESFAQPPR